MSTLPADFFGPDAEADAAITPRGRGRPGTYPPGVPDIEYLAHYRTVQLSLVGREIRLEALDVWCTVQVPEEGGQATVYVALSFTSPTLPVVVQDASQLQLFISSLFILSLSL